MKNFFVIVILTIIVILFSLSSCSRKSLDREIIAILNEELSFIDNETKKSATILTLPQINDNYLGTAGRYTIFDIDQDDKVELLVEYNVNGDIAIITYFNNKWTAYYVPYRAIASLSTDGTMLASSSAYESNIQRINFSNDGIVFIDIITSNDNTKEYTINGKQVSKDECQNEFNKQFEKRLVEWFDL